MSIGRLQGYCATTTTTIAVNAVLVPTERATVSLKVGSDTNTDHATEVVATTSLCRVAVREGDTSDFELGAHVCARRPAAAFRCAAVEAEEGGLSGSVKCNPIADDVDSLSSVEDDAVLAPVFVVDVRLIGVPVEIGEAVHGERFRQLVGRGRAFRLLVYASEVGGGEINMLTTC